MSIAACTVVPVGTSQPTRPLPKKLPEKRLPYRLVNVLAPVKVWVAFNNATFVDSRASPTVPVARREASRDVSAAPFPPNTLPELVRMTVLV